VNCIKQFLQLRFAAAFDHIDSEQWHWDSFRRPPFSGTD
jgi:hypothetical protein